MTDRIVWGRGSLDGLGYRLAGEGLAAKPCRPMRRHLARVRLRSADWPGEVAEERVGTSSDSMRQPRMA